ncbi:unnamed protein product, partial [Candidula unifasciata]
MKSSKTAKANIRSSSLDRLEDPSSNDNGVCVSVVSTNQRSQPIKLKPKRKTNQEIPENTLCEPRHIPGRQPAVYKIKQCDKEKQKRYNTTNPQPMQDDSLLPKKMTHSSKSNFSSNDISVPTKGTKKKENNSTRQQSVENESTFESELPTEEPFTPLSDSIVPEDVLQNSSHDIENSADGALQDSKEVHNSERVNANKTKAIHKHLHSIRGRETVSSKSDSHERCANFARTPRSSRPTTVDKEVPPRARRCLSFNRDNKQNVSSTVRVNIGPSPESPIKRSEENSSSVDSLRNLNLELRDQVLDLRQLRQQEHERLTLALAEQKEKLDREKAKELEHIRDQLTAKAELDLQKLTRHKDAEITKLKMEVSCKDVMLNIDVRRSKLLDDLKELRREKKELEDTLNSAEVAGRTFSNDLRRHSQNFELEMAKVKREAQLEIKQLIYKTTQINSLPFLFSLLGFPIST